MILVFEQIMGRRYGRQTEGMMPKAFFKVKKTFCDECSFALRRFVGHMDGVESINIEEQGISIIFDGEKVTEKELARITKDSIEKLGYGVEEQG